MVRYGALVNEVIAAAAQRYLMKYRGRPRTPKKDTGPEVRVPDAPPVAARQHPGLVPPRMHDRQPQKGRPNGTTT